MNPKMNLNLIASFLLVAVLGAGIAGGTVWWLVLSKPKAAEIEKAPTTGKKARRYLTLEKVIVMLRREPGDTGSHYMSADLVISTTEEMEKQAKEHLPLLRSIAVKSLSTFSVEKAAAMTVDQFAEQINRAFEVSYADQNAEKPFSEVMIGKLIIE